MKRRLTPKEQAQWRLTARLLEAIEAPLRRSSNEAWHGAGREADQCVEGWSC